MTTGKFDIDSKDFDLDENCLTVGTLMHVALALDEE